MNYCFLRYSFLVLILSFISDISAQVFDRRGQAIYVEMGGPAVAYSINYDMRFLEKTDGPGIRAGISFTGDWSAFPINLSYAFGKKDKSNFLELTLGATFFLYKDELIHGGKATKNEVAGALGIFYRHHSRLGKFFFKVGIPVIYSYLNDGDEERTVFPWFGMSIGRAF